MKKRNLEKDFYLKKYFGSGLCFGMALIVFMTWLGGPTPVYIAAFFLLAGFSLIKQKQKKDLESEKI